MKTEQLKVIAEAMGYKTEIYEGKLCVVSELERCFNGKPLLKAWNPETNASQTLMVLEWFVKECGDGGVEYCDEEWTATFREFGVASDKANYASVNHEDFQTAVCMAALEYIKNQKQ